MNNEYADILTVVGLFLAAIEKKTIITCLINLEKKYTSNHIETLALTKNFES